MAHVLVSVAAPADPRTWAVSFGSCRSCGPPLLGYFRPYPPPCLYLMFEFLRMIANFFRGFRLAESAVIFGCVFFYIRGFFFQWGFLGFFFFNFWRGWYWWVCYTHRDTEIHWKKSKKIVFGGLKRIGWGQFSDGWQISIYIRDWDLLIGSNYR